MADTPKHDALEAQAEKAGDEKKSSAKSGLLLLVLLVVLVVLTVISIVIGPATTPAENPTAAPTENTLAEAVPLQQEIVVTSNPLASAAGARILALNGTAADAMIAVQTVLSMVEPQSSGIGGGAFVVYYTAEGTGLTTIDAREKAPAAMNELSFDGLDFADVWQSGRSVGVPGVPRMLEKMYDDFGGNVEWEELFVDAIRLARDGYEFTGRSNLAIDGLLARNPDCVDRLYLRDPVAFEHYVDVNEDGTCQAKAEGTIMTNIPYAETMEDFQANRATNFYSGPIGQDIVDAVVNDLNVGGVMTVEDLQAYDVVEREPVCFEFREKEVCGMGPPSSGALALGQILGIVEALGAAEGEPLDVSNIHKFSQAGRLAFADRGAYVGDSDFVSVPIEGMLDKDYLAERATLVGESDIGVATPGSPEGAPERFGEDRRAKTTGTSHVSIMDKFGNALSMTTTVESGFGNGVMTNGFLLNNQLTDFSFAATDADGNPIANRPEANKRPRSSMSPSIVFGDTTRENVEIVTGSPGGSRIIGYTAQSIFSMVDFGLDPQEAINLPHYQNRNGESTQIEAVEGTTVEGKVETYDEVGVQAGLEAIGYAVDVASMTSGLSIIQVVDDGFLGGSDKRRDGTVSGV